MKLKLFLSTLDDGEVEVDLKRAIRIVIVGEDGERYRFSDPGMYDCPEAGVTVSVEGRLSIWPTGTNQVSLSGGRT